MKKLTHEEILALQFSEKFVQLMKNQAIVAYYSHGPTSGNVDNIDMLNEAIKRIEEYIDTGNQEGLVDAANFCMIEFIWPRKHEEVSLETSEVDRDYDGGFDCKEREQARWASRAIHIRGTSRWEYGHEGD
jgi:hypothetical protein